ncbi:MAG: carbon starvation protein A [Bacteroidales bacterium]|nr:carbon starvation protein A [Bacteroidales bacterium]
MVTFVISLVLLVAGYFIYGRVTEKIFGIDKNRQTPAYTKQDGVDYVPMKSWRIFLIQFLNIAGLGPIFGAIMGAKFGTSSFLWIVFGCIFAGAVHDFLSGMILLRLGGVGLPEVHGKYLGRGVRVFMRYFTVLLLILVGAVFISGPAEILAGLVGGKFNQFFWIVVIFVYYIVATLVPIDKLIGKIYPVFGFCLLFMAAGIMVSLFVFQPQLPEIWNGLDNKMPDAANNPIFPMMFVSIACGAISGFHATQSPLMARCLTNEKQARPIFYGSMITEGVVALVWAAAASFIFYTEDGQALLGTASSTPASIVNILCNSWLGPVGAILAVLGVIAAPITSGDTAFRSARLIIAESFKIDQKPFVKRILVAVPLFILGLLVLIYSFQDKDGFAVIWNGFSWANQFMAMVTLWAITVCLAQNKKWFWISLLPALFMTMVCSSYLLISTKTGFGLPHTLGYILSGVVTFSLLVWFFVWKIRNSKNFIPSL